MFARRGIAIRKLTAGTVISVYVGGAGKEQYAFYVQIFSSDGGGHRCGGRYGIEAIEVGTEQFAVMVGEGHGDVQCETFGAAEEGVLAGVGEIQVGGQVEGGVIKEDGGHGGVVCVVCVVFLCAYFNYPLFSRLCAGPVW